MPQLEESVAAHLCPSLTTEKPQLLLKPCRLTASLADKSYKAAGQAAALLNTICLLKAYQANLLCKLEGNATLEMYVELHMATDFCFTMAKEVAQNVGPVMGFSVITHCHLWLNLTQMA